ncbi:hypothetical protein LIER_39556 [Lithospermum erythrorhizon]|uniref:MSP domain-containing protein n=1 Tax=Lithospermum erythrorhizon TaxID=34254 RepID=A0AAV3QGK7_LITER
MDRLVKTDVQELHLQFIKGKKCSSTFKLTNLMHTMSVAISLTTTNPSIFSISKPLSIIPPLATSSYTLSFSQTCSNNIPPQAARMDTIMVRTSMLPTGKAHQDDLRRLFSKPGRHIFKDAMISIFFVGPHVVEYLISYSPKTLEVTLLLPKAISGCDEYQLNYLLKQAAKMGNPLFVSSLIDAGADVNSRDSEGQSAMSIGVEFGNVKVVQVLIESGFVMNRKFDWFLHVATAMDCVEMLEVLCLGYDDIDVNSVDSKGQTALHVASIHGHVEVVRFLISVGSDPDIADTKGWTPLHFSAQEGHLKVVKVLLDHSIFSKNTVTKEGKTAYALAAERGHDHLYDMLHLEDLLHRAARVGDVHSMKSCLAEGGNVNAKDQNGWTPLHRAVFKGHIECVKLLILHGAVVDTVDDEGHTPFYLATEAGHSQVSLHLISHGAKANMKSLERKNSRDWNCFKNHASSVVKPLTQERY